MKRKNKLNYIPLFLITILSILWFDSANKKKSLENTYNLLEISDNEVNNNFYNITGYFFAIDGDSLRKKDIEIRLLEIDSPEYRQTCFDKNDKEYDCGKISTNFLRKLVKDSKLNCKYQKKDMYDRYLANCYDGDKNINHEMIKNGMAIIYNINQASHREKELEKQARDNKIGIWQGKFLSPKEFRKMTKNER